MPPHSGLGGNLIAPVHARYRVVYPYGLKVSGWIYAEGDELEKESPLRQQPELLRMLVDQRKLEIIAEEEAPS